MGPDFIVTVRYGEASELRDVRLSMEGRPDLLRRGPTAVLYTIMDRVVENCDPVLTGLENDVDEIEEEEVFGGEPGVSRRIYELFREVIQFHRAAKPLAGALDRLTEGDARDSVDTEIQRYLRGVRDRVLRAMTMVSIQQNNQMQRISAWAAILIVPTIITGIYVMYFEYMLLLMAVCSGLLYLGFRRSGWL